VVHSDHNIGRAAEFINEIAGLQRVKWLVSREMIDYRASRWTRQSVDYQPLSVIVPFAE
jgi:hypothetical protein